MEERLVALLRLALKYNATDIHFDLIYPEIKIEMRINGLFKRVKTKSDDYKLIRYLQYLSNLDVGNILKPQTGQFELDVDGYLLSLRFAIISSVSRVNGVLRILNSNLKVEVDNLSIVKKQNEYFKSLFKRQSGLVLFSGPTGSGKTTTIYTLLKSVKNKKIYSIEDPIEVYIDNIVQLQVNEVLGFNYENGVAQILRHDPDIIMIGEIRDEKAAKIAIVAANTGHLVFSTIHSSSAKSVISRMVELGVSQSHLYENLLCIANQRMFMARDNINKVVLYEIMDEDEILYFKENDKNSKQFIDLNKQIRLGRQNEIIA